VDIFGSTLMDLASKGSDMDMTLLFDQYLVDNQYKQQKLPKIEVRRLSKTDHGKNCGDNTSNNSKDNSDSNMTEAVEQEIDENIDIDEEGGEQANLNTSDLTLKESIKKFFVRIDFFKLYLSFYIKLLFLSRTTRATASFSNST
jgi:hypothetical protein